MRMKLGDGNYRLTPPTDDLTPPDDWRARLTEESGRDREEVGKPRRRRRPQQRTPQQERFAMIAHTPVGQRLGDDQ